MPTVRYLDKSRRPLPGTAPAEKIAFSVYEIRIKPNMRYQPHPAFAPENMHLTQGGLRGIHALGDFPHRGTRAVTAADYAYQIKRLAHPQLHTPILGVMSEYIVGLKDFSAALQQTVQRDPDAFLDLNEYPLRG